MYPASVLSETRFSTCVNCVWRLRIIPAKSSATDCDEHQSWQLFDVHTMWISDWNRFLAAVWIFDVIHRILESTQCSWVIKNIGRITHLPGRLTRNLYIHRFPRWQRGIQWKSSSNIATETNCSDFGWMGPRLWLSRLCRGYGKACEDISQRGIWVLLLGR